METRNDNNRLNTGNIVLSVKLLVVATVFLSLATAIFATGYSAGDASHTPLYADAIRGKTGGVVSVTDDLTVTGDTSIIGPVEGNFVAGGANSALQVGVGTEGNIRVGDFQIYRSANDAATNDDAKQGLVIHAENNPGALGVYQLLSVQSSGHANRFSVIHGGAEDYANQFYDSLAVGATGYTNCSKIPNRDKVDCGRGAEGDLFVADDVEIQGDLYVDGTIIGGAGGGSGTGWSTGAGTIYNTTASVGIGTASPITSLDVAGTIRGGDVTATQGALILVGQYGAAADDHITTLGSHYSSAGTVLGYATKPKSGAAGYVSSADNIAWARGVATLDSSGFHVILGPAQATAVDSDVTVTEYLTVLNTGNVGIGKPAPGMPLDVAGTIRSDTQVEVTNSAGVEMDFQGGSATNIYSDGSIVWRIDQDNDGSNLFYWRDGANNNIMSLSEAGTLTSLTGQICDINGCISPGTSPVWSELSGNAYRSTGYVGIGTSTPTAKLHMTGTGAANGILLDDGRIYDSGSWLYAIHDTSKFWLGTGDVYFNLGEAAGVDNFHIRDSASALRFVVDSDGNVRSAGCTRIDGAMAECSLAESLIVDGNVGIGNTNPTDKLVVTGNIQATGNLDFDGEILPDGLTCANGQILKKTAAGNWDCASDSSGHSDGTDCASGQGARGVDANGNAELCQDFAEETDIHSDGSDCASDSGARGVDANGNAELCTKFTRVTGSWSDNRILRSDGSGEVAQACTAVCNDVGDIIVNNGRDLKAGDFFFYGSSGTNSGVPLCRDTGNHEIEDCSPSSRRFKTNIEPLQGSLNMIQNLKPVTYIYLGRPDENLQPDDDPVNEHNDLQTGLIAEDVGAAIPYSVVMEEILGNWTVADYQDRAVLAALVGAIQEQQVMIEDLQRQVTALEAT